jgi:hypothetical protein
VTAPEWEYGNSVAMLNQNVGLLRQLLGHLDIDKKKLKTIDFNVDSHFENEKKKNVF